MVNYDARITAGIALLAALAGLALWFWMGAGEAGVVMKNQNITISATGDETVVTGIDPRTRGGTRGGVLISNCLEWAQDGDAYTCVRWVR